MERLLAAIAAVGLVFVLAFHIVRPLPGCDLAPAAVRFAHRALFSLETWRWQTLEGDHFLVRYRRGDEENARMVLQEAEKLYYPLGEAFGCFPQKKVPIAVYRDRASLNRVFGWGSEESAMGVYWAGVIRILSPQDWIDAVNDEERSLIFRKEGPVAHEYIHLLVDYKTAGNTPRWLTEGLAQYGEKRYAGVAAAGGEGRESLKLTLEALERHFNEPEWQDYSYAVSEDLVEYLVEKHGAGCLPAILEALGRGKTLDEALQEGGGEGLADFLRSYQESVA